LVESEALNPCESHDAAISSLADNSYRGFEMKDYSMFMEATDTKWRDGTQYCPWTCDMHDVT